jgi:hypothetical protein
MELGWNKVCELAVAGHLEHRNDTENAFDRLLSSSFY